MGRGNETADLINLADPDEVAAYNPQSAEEINMMLPCTEDDFKLDLDGLPTSSWNIGVAHVFTRSFMREYTGFDADEATIAGLWLTHATSLRRAYLNSQLAPKDVERKQQEARRKARRDNVSELDTVLTR